MTTQPVRMERDTSPATVCPHLGVEEDRLTCLAYPSRWNLCHKCKPAAAVRLGHQRRMCLSPAHTDCPVFMNEAGMSLPVDLRLRPD